MIEISKKLRVNVEKDLLFDEINAFNLRLSQNNSNDKNLDTISRYCEYLSSLESPNLLKIVETVLAIPIGNDFVERVFSHLKKNMD